jgi:hypothetical protein
VDCALDCERPKIQLSEIELAAAGFREALHSDRGVDALRGCLEVGRFSPEQHEHRSAR